MKQSLNCNTIIIGGGPAGLFAGIHLKKREVILLEKNSSPGRKLLISGSGRCNLTHAGNNHEFLRHYGDHHHFLKNALMNFTNADLQDYFSSIGLKLTSDKNGKVFPLSDDAGEVLHMLVDLCLKNRVRIIPNQAVRSIEKMGEVFHIITSQDSYHCSNLLIATGGKSYPGTGSTGDGYTFAQMMGHTIIPPRPALTPVFIRDYPFAELAGVSLDETRISIYRNNKKVKEGKGDIGFTHKGLSGPGILDLSRFMESQDTLKVNLCGQDPDVFRKDYIETCASSGKIAIQTYLKKYPLPKSLLKKILAQLQIDPEINMAMIDKKARTRLTEALCEYPFFIEKMGGFSMAMTTAGGVALEEINPKTMQSRLVKNLYFAGEVLDIDGDTGGYNLQAAFSTGFLAARAVNGEG